jgi:CRP/FNR family transcriptional regulator, cyclic AMP receptor protein
MSLREALKQVDLFRALPDSALDEIIATGTTFTLIAGTTLVIEGSTDAGFQIVKRGSAEVSVNGVDRGSITEGGYFGEMSLIDHHGRSATIAAGPEGVETFAISALAFASLMDRYPQVARALLPVLTARIRAIEATQSPPA